jgi:DNA replication protein DnaC
MSERTNTPESTTSLSDVEQHLTYLKLSFMMEQYATLAKHAAQKAWSHVDYLTRLAEGEATLRRDRATKSRIRLAHFPVIKTVEQFRWDWPTRINRLQVQNHFHLAFVHDKANLILLGGVGLGKPCSGNYPCRSQIITGTHHYRYRSPSPPVWPDPHTGCRDAPQ